MEWEIFLLLILLFILHLQRTPLSYPRISNTIRDNPVRMGRNPVQVQGEEKDEDEEKKVVVTRHHHRDIICD